MKIFSFAVLLALGAPVRALDMDAAFIQASAAAQAQAKPCPGPNKRVVADLSAMPPSLKTTLMILTLGVENSTPSR